MTMLFKRILVALITVSLTGCGAGLDSLAKSSKPSKPTVGPSTSSQIEQQSKIAQIQRDAPKLDVVIPVFDAGLNEAGDDENVWPEMRRAEANRFAWKLKDALESSGKFNVVRVTPDQNATGELYVVGRIVESSGEDVEIAIQVFDISGRDLITANRTSSFNFLSGVVDTKKIVGDSVSEKSFSHSVDDEFFKDIRNKGKDSYQPVFDDAAAYVVTLLKDLSVDETVDLKKIADLRFAASFSNEAFAEHMTTSEDGTISLVSMPAENDATLEKVRAIRIRDQLFVDKLQVEYQSFNQKFEKSHSVWQEQVLVEAKARSDARKKAAGQAVGAAILIGLAVAAGKSVDREMNSSTYDPTAATLGAYAAIGAGIGAIGMIGNSVQSVKEAEMHNDLIKELGQSVDMEVAPQVVAFEESQAELVGTASEQFTQWRAFLKKIYELEKTPDRQL